jgi:hypothetical protein
MSINPIGIRISGPLAGFAEGYGAELTQLGYASASVRLQMKVLADLSDWLLSHDMAAADLRRSDLDRFLRHRRAAGHTRYVVKVPNCCEFDNREEIKTRVECCLGRRGEQRHRAPTVQ